MVVHAGRALTSFYQCGALYQLDPQTLEQYGAARWHRPDGEWFPSEGVSAHAKVDRATGELLFFNYGKAAPYMHCGVIDATGRLSHYQPVPLPGPRLPHDMAYTRRFMIFNDLPLFWDASLFDKGLHVARMHDLPSRFALVPRPGFDGDIRWFEADPTYVLHFINAWEDGDTVVLDGYRQRCPMPPPLAGAPREYAMLLAYTDLHSLKPQLWRWCFDLKTGRCSEQALDDGISEFGTYNHAYAMQQHRYVYDALGEPGQFLFNGLCKHDLESGTKETLSFGAGIYGSEAPFAPRNGSQSEDDGYVVTFITDLNRDCSECWIYAAQDLGAGPVAKVRLPARIPSGTHACWMPAADLSSR